MRKDWPVTEQYWGLSMFRVLFLAALWMPPIESMACSTAAWILSLRIFTTLTTGRFSGCGSRQRSRPSR